MVIAPNDDFSVLLEKEGCFYIPIQFNNRSENPLQDFSLYTQLKKLYKREQPDFIFSLCYKTQYLWVPGCSEL